MSARYKKNNALVEEHLVRPKTSLVIFDWDDTLFPTSLGSHLISKDVNSLLLKKLDKKIYKLINKCLLTSTVIIVSNATRPWIIHSCKLAYPQTYQLFNKSVTVISARDMCNKIQEHDMNVWKIRTCRAYLDMKPQIKYVISLGDSIQDEITINALKKIYKNKLFTFVKFQQAPTVELLYKEIKYVSKKLNKLMKKEKYSLLNNFFIIILFIIVFLILFS
jgi:hypothetical protein